MRAQAWRTLRAFTQAVAVLATLVATHTPATHPVPSQGQSTDSDPAVDLATRGATQDSLSRAALRGLSLEQQFQGPMVVTRDPQWTTGMVHRLSPPVRSPRERITRPRLVATAAIRVLESFIEIRDKLNFLRGRVMLTVRAAPARARAALLRLMTVARSSPASAARFSESPAVQDASHRLRWVWMLHPLTHQSWYDVQRHFSADWVPWRPRGPPASGLRTFRQDAIQ